MSGHLLIVHLDALRRLPELQLDHFLDLFRSESRHFLSSPALMLQVVTLKPLSRLSSLLLFLRNFVQLLGVIFMHDFFLLNVSDFAQAIVRHLHWPLLLPGLGFWRWIDFFLLFFDKPHELIDIVQWVILHFIILLAAGAVSELMLLADKIFYNSFYIW